MLHSLRRRVTRTVLDVGNRNSPCLKARQRRELAVNELGIFRTSEHRPRRLAAAKRAKYTEIQGAIVSVRVAVVSQSAFVKMLPNTRPNVVKVPKSTKPDMPQPPILVILPDVWEQTGVASVRETAGEMIHTIVPLGVTPALLRSKPRPELLFQPPDLVPAILRRYEPGTAKLAALEHTDDALIVQCELDIPSDLRCPRHPQADQESASPATIR